MDKTYFKISFFWCLVLTFGNFLKAQDSVTRIEQNHRVYIPDGNGPFSVIIAIPGCSGVSFESPQTDEGRPGDEADRLFRRHYARMAERLKDAGFMVYLIDYLSAEGVMNACSGEVSKERVSEYIDGTIPLVKQDMQSDTSQIHMIGWSWGGVGVLSWLASLEEEPVGLKSVVTVYPGCGSSKTWDVSISTMMVLGNDDDIAPPEECTELINSLPSKTNITVKRYPDARHGFDLTEGPEMLSVGGGFTIGKNEKAGKQAWEEILSFLGSN